MKTFAVRLIRDTKIEGVDYKANFQVGAITSEVGTQTLLGLLQFGHAVADEITDSPDGDEDDAGSDADEDQPGDVVEGSADEPAGDPAGESAESGEETSDQDDGDKPANEGVSPVAEFLAAGLDNKTAEALVDANNIQSLAELQALMADPEFDLLDLEEVGAVRAEKIRAIFAEK